MGEQYLTITITSEKPIDWNIGDFCQFRGETYTLNYVPSVTQKAGTKEKQDAYTYENVKFESYQEELTRCLMLDITPTTGDYVAALGTNYTGSSKFTLFCGETTANGITLTAVCALAAKMQANLDRIYRTNGWSVLVDTTTHVTTASGDIVLATHTEDKILSFDNTSVAAALVEVHNTFKLDYCIRGRNIYIGYNLKNLTSDNDNETFSFGYGKGYPTRNSMNKGLFQIKRIANSNQKIVTRLRALGSTKNMPYRYYNKTYSHGNDALSQTLFPTNLQLPDTFETQGVKATKNAERDSIYGVNPLTNLPNLRHVKGDTNDAYIDKNDDAANCSDGIREDSARWDGTNADLPEIYPTIEEATYDELRGALVQDQDGNTGNSSFPNYSGSERIDKLLAIGYKDGETIVDDANIGDGILPESGISYKGIARSASLGMTNLLFDPSTYGDFTYNTNYYAGKERKLFSIQGVAAGKYAIAPTLGAVIYGFSLNSHINNVGVDVGFIITVKQKNLQTGAVNTIATYISDFTSITKSDGIVEVELPEIPDVVNGDNAKVSEIRVTALSDITVYFTPTIKNVSLPNGSTGGFSLVYQVGNSRLDHTVTSESEYTWIPVEDSDTLTNIFHVFVQDMGFDIEACWSDDTPIMSMKSGHCVGREFEIMEDVQKVTYDGKKGYMLTLQRAEDSSLGTYYPSQTNPISAEDHFVLLGIQMPGAYVKMAEVRLLRAATQYLADNYETKFTYQPYIDDIYLQRNYDNMVANGTPEKSIFWRLYAGLKFTFRGIPTSEDAPLPLAEITIEKVSISMGDGLTPKVELTLNDDVQQGTIQKLTTSVDRIYNGSIFSGDTAGVGTTGAIAAALISILQSEGGKLFLSKIDDDVADGKITFNNVVTHNDLIKAKKGLRIGNFQSRFLGSGAMIDEEGNAEFESIYSRSFISTPEFRFNRITVTEGEQWCTNGYGTIQEVEVIDDMTGYITLKLEENDYSSIFVGDICRGIYNDIATQFETESLDDDSELYAGESESNVEGFGFSCKKGFFTSYFWVKQMITNKRGECKFLYELRNNTTPHPCEFMKFAQYGSFTNSDRRSSSYATSIGHYYEMVLDGVNNWKIRSVNVVYRKGWLGDMTVSLKGGREVELKGYGLYAQDNVYFGNAIVQLDVETLADIENSLKIYEVDFSGYVDVITVDDVGNCIGGLWTVSGENDEYRDYRIHSAITVRKNGKLLTLAADNEDAGEGTFKLITQPHGCTCVVENSTIIITGIDNIKDGVAGSSDDVNFDYNAMRNTDNCSVDILIDCEGKTSIQKNFPITIKHESQPYVGADISNEFSGVSWNTQTQQYIGLPITFDMKMWHNNEILDIVSVNDVSLTSATGGVTLVNGTAPATPAETSIYYTKSIITENGHKHARITLTAIGKRVPTVTDIDVTSTAVYSGVSYERTLRHTINKSTDTNVFSLLPSISQVIFNKNANTLSSNSLTCSVVCDSSDDKHFNVAYADFSKHNIEMYYKKFYTNGTSDTNETKYNNSAISINTSVLRVEFYLYGITGGSVDRSIIHDTESVCVIADGKDGQKGDTGNKGDKGNTGDNGLNGCIQRVFQTFTAGQTYYYDENTVKTGIRYNDFLAIEDNSVSSGYRVYQCTQTHVAASSFSADSSKWSEVSVNVASAFFTFLIAKNANIKILSSAQFTIAETNGSVVAGLANTSVPLWVGSGTPSSAPFRVTREGKLYATGAEISGKITATSGNIGGFSLANDGITHIVSQADMSQGSNKGYVICRNDYYGRFAGIGANVLPALSGNATAVGRFENTDTHGWWSSNIALLLKATNGTYNFAFTGEGNGVLNGAVDGFKLNSFTPSSSDNTIPIKDGNRVLLKNSSYKTVYLPTLNMCRNYLGIGSSTYFAIELIIMAASGASGMNVYGYVDSSHGNDCPHIRSNDEYQDITGGIVMGAGDILHFILVYDGSFNAFVISHRD